MKKSIWKNKSIFNSVKSSISWKENVWFLDSLNFVNIPDLPTRCDGRVLFCSGTIVSFFSSLGQKSSLLCMAWLHAQTTYELNQQSMQQSPRLYCPNEYNVTTTLFSSEILFPAYILPTVLL